MLRSAASKAMALGRFASAVFGLALILALVFGVATMALGANGEPFLLGKGNAASLLTRLTGDVDGPAMQVTNKNAGDNDTALSLSVQRGEAPIEVNSAAKVADLNADRVDGKDATDLLPGGTVPTGATIRGNYEIDGHASAAGELVGGDSISFGYKLPSKPTGVFVAAGTDSTEQCPGTYPSPQARPGYLCVYEGAYINKQTGSPIVYPVTTVGAGIYLASGSAGSSYSSGTWAVTVPSAAQAAKLPSSRHRGAADTRP
jgi:hypothetical protein